MNTYYKSLVRSDSPSFSDVSETYINCVKLSFELLLIMCTMSVQSESFMTRSSSIAQAYYSEGKQFI